MAEAMARRGPQVTGIDPAADAIDAARAHSRAGGLRIGYDVGFAGSLPYDNASFDAVVCVNGLEQVVDLNKVLAEIAHTLRPGRMFLFDRINRNPLARLATITLAEDMLRLLPRWTHDPIHVHQARRIACYPAGCGAGAGCDHRPWPARDQSTLI